ncbi:MAG: OmpA family protein [Candidatus Rokubacteria bacterium]|nr:OmpA family protein [Candidatus Rokubacteria bacterium]
MFRRRLRRQQQQDPRAVRIVVRRPKRHGEPHGGAWKVAYADFMTTMMALFIVLWASSQNVQVREAIGAYFRTPAVWSQAGRASVLNGGAGILPMQPRPASAATALEPGDDLTLEGVAKWLAELIEAEGELKKLQDQIRIDVTADGLRIQLVEKDDSVFFDIGSATLKPATRRLLAIIARVAGRLPNEVTIEGHTDSRPYQGTQRDYSNWELSADRANSARRAMEESGLRPRQVTRVIGYADHQLLEPTNPRDSQNRRVSIIIKRRSEGAVGSRERSQLLAEIDGLPGHAGKNIR